MIYGIVLALSLPLVAQERVIIDRFSEESALAGWRTFRFRKTTPETRYSLEKEGDNGFMAASSTAAASGLFKDVDIDLAKLPVLTWRWRVDRLPEGADGRKRAKDDFAARLYVAFPFDPAAAGPLERWKFKAAKKRFGDFVPGRALVYIWDGRELPGKFYPNAFADRAMMVVVESGPRKLGRWVRESRNVFEDYKQAFGEDPPKAAYVAVMTDTDNTKSAASAAYDDIVFSAE